VSIEDDREVKLLKRGLTLVVGEGGGQRHELNVNHFVEPADGDPFPSSDFHNQISHFLPKSPSLRA